MIRYAWLLIPALAHAQCVMCGRTAAAQNAARVDVLLQGTLILLAGPILIGGLIAALVWKRRRLENIDGLSGR